MIDEKVRAQLHYAALQFSSNSKVRYKNRELLVEFGEFLFELCDIDLSALGLEEKMERIYRELLAQRDLSGPPLIDVEIFPPQEDVDEGSMWVQESFKDEYEGPTYTSFFGEGENHLLDLRLRWTYAVSYQVTKHIIYPFFVSKGFIYAGGASLPPEEEECHFTLRSAQIDLHINLVYHHPAVLLKELVSILERLPARLQIGRRGTNMELEQLVEEMQLHIDKYENTLVWAGHVVHPLEQPFIPSAHLNLELN